MLYMFYPQCGYVLGVSLWYVLLCKGDLNFPGNTNVIDFHSLWITFYFFKVHMLAISFLFILSCILHTHWPILNSKILFVFYELYIQNYSPWSIQILSVFAWYLQRLLKAPRIKSKLLSRTMWSDTCPRSTILLHHSAPHTLILLFFRHTRHDTLSTWKSR